MASLKKACHDSSPITPAAAAMILGQFDQKTQLQALTMLRQLNAQQQLQQMQQIQQLQQLQALHALQKLQMGKKLDVKAGQEQAQRILSSALKPPTGVTTAAPPIKNYQNPLKIETGSSDGCATSTGSGSMLANKNSFSSAASTSGASVTNSSASGSRGAVGDTNRKSGGALPLTISQPALSAALEITKQLNQSSRSFNSQPKAPGHLKPGAVFNGKFPGLSQLRGNNGFNIRGTHSYHHARSNHHQFQPVKRERGPDGDWFVVPNDESAKQIMLAAEYYFSDENLSKDHYLLRQICQKSEGYLSVKLLTALKNVKRLTKDWRVTSYCLSRSKFLKLNEEQTKVKRVAELPEHVLKARQITNIIAIKIPLEFSSVSAITTLFAEYGKITLVRVLLPGRQVPCDLRNYATQVPDMGNSLCAVVEFDTETEACLACRELNNRRYPSGMRTALLGPRLRRNLYKLPVPGEDGLAPASICESEEHGATISSAGSGIQSWSNVVVNGKSPAPTASTHSGDEKATQDGAPKRDSGCDSASTHSSQSPPNKTFDRAPGAGRKQVKMSININGYNGSGNVIRQPRGPTNAMGGGFFLRRSHDLGAK